MHQARQAFDVRSPFIVASEELVYGVRRYLRGEAFPWRQLKVDELDLLTLWSALKIDCLASAPPPSTAESPASTSVAGSAVAAPAPVSRPQHHHGKRR